MGEYSCVRGEHRLEHMEKPFIAFEITGVPPFKGNPVTKILFHVGNWNIDSEGCVLLGSQIGNMNNGGLMLMASGDAFKKFMELMNGVDEFSLTVDTLT